MLYPNIHGCHRYLWESLLPVDATKVFVLFTLITSVYIPTCQSEDLLYGVARALPFTDRAISGSAMTEFPTGSRIQCLMQCQEYNCSSFNFGNSRCELHGSYLCEGSYSLVVRSGFKHYDVEFGEWIPIADVYRNTTGCRSFGYCSPKCHLPTTTTTTTPTTTTTTPTTTTTTPTTTTTTPTTTTTTPTTTTTTPTTTTTTPTTTTTTPTTTTTTPTTTTTTPTTTTTTPTTTTTTPTTTTTTPTTTTTTPTTTTTTPTTTTTTPTTTTTTPTTTTTTPTTTTTTTPTTTTTTPTTTTTTPTTTTTTPTTTAGAPVTGPGDVNYPCSTDPDCTAANSDCRSSTICECVAGFSYLPSANECVRTCPDGYDDTWHETLEWYVIDNDDTQTTNSNIDDCKQMCIDSPTCAAIDFDLWFEVCRTSSVTKFGYESDWYYDYDFVYFQRNCK